MALRVVSVHLEYLDHDTGHWCNTCRLGTGIRIWVAVSIPGRMHLQQRLYCYECDGRDVTIDPEALTDGRHR